MATAAPSEPKVTECVVCKEELTEPKVIPCGHVLCKHCVSSWLKSKAGASCPMCRFSIVDPGEHKGKTSAEVIDSFPTESALECLVESEQLLSKDQMCQGCVTNKATSVCLQCSDFLCSSCVAIHKRLSLSRDHTVESLSSLTPEKLAASRPTFCSTHPDETCSFFCPTHDETFCQLCVASKHRNCTGVMDLGEKVKEAHTVLEEMAATLTAVEARLEQAIDQLDQHLLDVEKQAHAAFAEIEETCDRLESAVKKCRHRLKELEKSACSEAKEAAQEAKTFLLQRRGRLTTHKGIIQRVHKMNTAGPVINMSAEMGPRVKGLDSSTTLPFHAKRVSSVKLIIDPQAVTGVEKALAELGKVKIVTTNLAVQPAILRFHENHGRNIVLSNNQQTAERRSGDLNGGIVVSSDSMIPGMVYEVLLNRRDNKWNSVMFVGVTTTAPDMLTLPDYAWNWPSAVVIRDNRVWELNKEKGSYVGQKLVNLPEGSRIGLMIDTTQSLHLYIDGQHQGVAATGVPDPCFAFFDVRGYYRKENSSVGQKLYDLPQGSCIGLMIDTARSLHLYIDGQHQGVAATDVPDPCFAFFDVSGHYRKITALPVTVPQ